MTRVITPIHKKLKKKRKRKKNISILTNTFMLLTRLQRNKKKQQQKRGKQTKPTATPQQKKPYDSKTKMQENRKDPEFRFNEDFRRIMKNIQTDEKYRPHHKTLTKYQIKLEEINRIREERNWEPLQINIPPEYLLTNPDVIRTEINAKAKYELSKLAKANRLVIKEKAGALEAYQEKLKAANIGKIVEVDGSELFSINTITQFFLRNPGTVGKNSKEERKPNTLKNYFGITVDKEGKRNWNGKSGKFFGLFNKWKEGHCNKDVRPCLKEIDDLSSWLLDEQTSWKPATKLAYLIPLLVVLSEYPPLSEQPLAEEARAKLLNVKIELEGNGRVDSEQRRQIERVSPFQDMKQAIYNTFQKKHDEPTFTGKISKEWLYIQMYDEQPARDNYGALKILFEDVPPTFLDRVKKNFKDPFVKKKLLEINEIGNILYVPEVASKPVTLAFHLYKTANTYGITFIPFSINLSRDIRLYISQLKNKTYLFGKSSMSNFVSKMLCTASIKKKKGDPGYQPGFNTQGAINLLRQAFVSRAYKDPSLSAVDKETLALAMKHSPMTSTTYLRKYGLKITEESKNELKKIDEAI